MLRHLLNSNRHFKDYRRAKPEAKLSEFISIFMGFTAYKIIKEIIDQVNELIGADENSSEKRTILMIR